VKGIVHGGEKEIHTSKKLLVKRYCLLGNLILQTASSFQTTTLTFISIPLPIILLIVTFIQIEIGRTLLLPTADSDECFTNTY
jgi:hypothetical protein